MRSKSLLAAAYLELLQLLLHRQGRRLVLKLALAPVVACLELLRQQAQHSRTKAPVAACSATPSRAHHQEEVCLEIVRRHLSLSSSSSSRASHQELDCLEPAQPSQLLVPAQAQALEVASLEVPRHNNNSNKHHRRNKPVVVCLAPRRPTPKHQILPAAEASLDSHKPSPPAAFCKPTLCSHILLYKHVLANSSIVARLNHKRTSQPTRCQLCRSTTITCGRDHDLMT